MPSDCLHTTEGAPMPCNGTSPNGTLQTGGTSARGKSEVSSQWLARKGSSLPNIICKPNHCQSLPQSHSAVVKTSLSDITEHEDAISPTSPTTLKSCSTRLELQTHSPAKLGTFPSSDVLSSDLSTPSSSIIAPSKAIKRLGYSLGDWDSNSAVSSLWMPKPVVADNDSPTAPAGDDPGGSSEEGDDNSIGFHSSMEESFHEPPGCASFPNCAMKYTTVTEERSCDSTGTTSLTDGKTADSGTDSGYGLLEGCSAPGSPQYDLERRCGVELDSDSFSRDCRHCGSATAYLSKELEKLKRESGEKDAALASLKEALKKQCVEKEDILLQKIQSDTDLRACEQQLETTRKSEMRYRTNFYQNTAEVNALQREVISLQGEVASRKIYANKLHAEIVQSNNMPNRNHCCGSIENEQTLQFRLEELKIRQNQDLDRTVSLLEKRLEHLQDEWEDMRFKAQRFAEETASLTSQNTQLVKQCGDLQRQLVECLATINVLDVHSKDAESRFKRAHGALEEKEEDLSRMSSERTAALLKIEENERELETVRSELSNVTRNFMKLSGNQLDLKEKMIRCKKIMEAKDATIQQLTDERDSLLSRRERQEEEPFARNKVGESRLMKPSEQSQQQTNNFWDEQSNELQKSYAVVDEMMSEQISFLKQENRGLVAEVQTLKKELNQRSANSVSRMVQIMETIERLEVDMTNFLEQKCEVVEGNKPTLASRVRASGKQANKDFYHKSNSEQESAHLIRENLELAQSLAKTKLEVDALRRDNSEMNEILKKRNSCKKGQQIETRQASKCLKRSPIDAVSIEPKLDQEESKIFCDLETSEKLAERSLETKASLLEKANNELVSYVESLHQTLFVNQSHETKSLEISQHVRRIPRDVYHAVDALSRYFILSAGSTVDELSRITVFLQICLLKTMSIVSKNTVQHKCHARIISGLENLLLNVRSVISFEENPEIVCKLIELPQCEAPVGEPNLLLASQTELENELADSRKNIQELRKALAVSEEERRKDQQRYEIRLYDLLNKFRLRLKENEPVSMKDVNLAVKEHDGNRDKSSPRSKHKVCTDMVVKLERDLRTCKHTILKLRDEVRAKNEETWQLHEEISTLRSEITMVHDILDNKKIALGRSEAFGQMLRVSQTSLEQRLELEQRQHEDCRQQLDRTLEKTRVKDDEIKDLRRQLVEKGEEMSAVQEQYELLSEGHRELLSRNQEIDDDLKLAHDQTNTQCCDVLPQREHKPEVGNTLNCPGGRRKRSARAWLKSMVQTRTVLLLFPVVTSNSSTTAATKEKKKVQF